jgi:hypothetical protein
VGIEAIVERDREPEVVGSAEDSGDLLVPHPCISGEP